MKAKQLAQVIRKIVQEEVRKEVKNVLTEQKVKDEGPMSLTEALTQTESEAYPTAKTFNSTDARAGFASMQTGFNTPQTPTAFEGHGGKIVSTDSVDPSISKAMTRDYSELVKRFKK